MWFVAPFSNSSTHRTDPVTLPLTTIQDTSTHTIYDTTPSFIYNNATLPTTSETVTTAQSSLYIGIGVLLSIVIPLSMIIVIIAIVYMKRKQKEPTITGQG